MLSCLQLTNALTVRGRPTPEQNEKETKLSRHSAMTSNTHRRNDKSECQEYTSKTDNTFKRGMYINLDRPEIWIAGNQCHNSDLDIHNAWGKQEAACLHNVFQFKPKQTRNSFVIAVTTVAILPTPSVFFSRVTLHVLVFVLCVVFFHVILYQFMYIATQYMYHSQHQDFALVSASFLSETLFSWHWSDGKRYWLNFTEAKLHCTQIWI